MKLTSAQLKQFIISEVNKLEQSDKVITEASKPKEIEFEKSNEIDKKLIEGVDIQEVKNLAEEVVRMKTLVDFRSPLLGE